MQFTTLVATSVALAAFVGAQVQNPGPNTTIGVVGLYGDSGCTNETNKFTETALWGGIGICYLLHYYPAPLDTTAIKIDFTETGSHWNCAFHAFTDPACRESPTVIDETGVCKSISDVSDSPEINWQSGALICA
ncbi:hypothetical protein GGR57DRAFT_480192 [Xylariaceae sp. FL1272]|nr:hypothetical protein GGR57DRAFT_480192 [Xylariaceae sp. FL1272]